MYANNYQNSFYGGPELTGKREKNRLCFALLAVLHAVAASEICWSCLLPSVGVLLAYMLFRQIIGH